MFWKCVLVGKEYFSINHLLFLLYNIGHLRTLLNKKVITRSSVKEFFMKCIEQFTVYIWMSTPFGKMKTYLRKITKETNIEIDPQRIISWDLWKINKHIMQFPLKKDNKRFNRPTHEQKFIIRTILIFSLGTIVLTLEIHLIKLAKIHPLMSFSLNLMRTCQKKIIIS